MHRRGHREFCEGPAFGRTVDNSSTCNNGHSLGILCLKYVGDLVAGDRHLTAVEQGAEADRKNTGRSFGSLALRYQPLISSTYANFGRTCDISYCICGKSGLLKVPIL